MATAMAMVHDEYLHSVDYYTHMRCKYLSRSSGAGLTT
jgi:hypothetical protein